MHYNFDSALRENYNVKRLGKPEHVLGWKIEYPNHCSIVATQSALVHTKISNAPFGGLNGQNTPYTYVEDLSASTEHDNHFASTEKTTENSLQISTTNRTAHIRTSNSLSASLDTKCIRRTSETVLFSKESFAILYLPRIEASAFLRAKNYHRNGTYSVSMRADALEAIPGTAIKHNGSL